MTATQALAIGRARALEATLAATIAAFVLGAAGSAAGGPLEHVASTRDAKARVVAQATGARRAPEITIATSNDPGPPPGHWRETMMTEKRCRQWNGRFHTPDGSIVPVCDVPLESGPKGPSAGATPPGALAGPEKAHIYQIGHDLINRVVADVYAPVYVQLRRAEWSSTKRPYTGDMAERDRQLAHLYAARVLIGYKNVITALDIAKRVGTVPGDDPRVHVRQEFEVAWANIAGFLSTLRGNVGRRHAAFAAELEQRFGGHEAFKEGTSARQETPGRDCEVDIRGTVERFTITDAADYRRYKAAHDDRRWATRSVRDDLLPLVAFAPCLAYVELVGRGDAREGLRVLGNDIEVSERLRVPSEMTVSEAQAMTRVILRPLLTLVAFLGWLETGMI